MKKKLVSGLAALLISLGSSPYAAGQQPLHCAQNQFCLFNQEATAGDPASIHKYSRDLVDLILPNQWTYAQSPSGKTEEFERELLGEDYAAKLADRLAQAEQAARTSNGRLVPEASVVEAFNDLMRGIGAPPSMRATESSVHEFRKHAASIKAFPALFSVAPNGTNCSPGEAVFLLYLLLSDNSRLSEHSLDGSVNLMREAGRGAGGSYGRMSTELIPSASAGAKELLFSYSLRRRHATEGLFNQMAQTFGFR